MDFVIIIFLCLSVGCSVCSPLSTSLTILLLDTGAEVNEETDGVNSGQEHVVGLGSSILKCKVWDLRTHGPIGSNKED